VEIDATGRLLFQKILVDVARELLKEVVAEFCNQYY